CWPEAAAHGLSHPALASAARTCFAAALGSLPRMGVGHAVVAATAEYAERYVARRRTTGDDLLESWIASPGRPQLTPA
ncbi:MAG: ergothioneine biosynthesis glutamate--cysteine ligase EgtA, partial [Actinomycetota bacterium]|nr:ergothioneine biosynthesis glutamate--cysteine ligase EgtA [Actinomycetota bacterium]